MEVGIVGPPDIVTSRVDQLELEGVRGRLTLDGKRKFVVRGECQVERTMDDGVSAVPMKIEIDAHRIAVRAVRIRMD